MSAVIVVPSLKISGGNREALRLATELCRDGHTASMLSLWVSPHEIDGSIPVTYLSSWPTRVYRAFGELPVLAFRFAQWWRSSAHRDSIFVFTHYATLPLAFLIPPRQRFFFVQGVEWNFVKNKIITWLLRHIIFSIYSTGRIISANSYLSQRLQAEGVQVDLEAPIWADQAFCTSDAPSQNIEFAMVLAKANLKRLDLYLDFIDLARAHHMRIAVITPEDDIITQVRNKVDEVLLRPSIAQMREIYSRSVCFIHLSDHEGFGLPPLEAMAAGCIPICRDSGGVRAFMSDGPCNDLLLPLSMSVEKIHARAFAVVCDPQRAQRRSAVRAHFEQGLARCVQIRNELFTTMLNESGK